MLVPAIVEIPRVDLTELTLVALDLPEQPTELPTQRVEVPLGRLSHGQQQEIVFSGQELGVTSDGPVDLLENPIVAVEAVNPRRIVLAVGPDVEHRVELCTSDLVQAIPQKLVVGQDLVCPRLGTHRLVRDVDQAGIHLNVQVGVLASLGRTQDLGSRQEGDQAGTRLLDQGLDGRIVVVPESRPGQAVAVDGHQRAVLVDKLSAGGTDGFRALVGQVSCPQITLGDRGLKQALSKQG